MDCIKGVFTGFSKLTNGYSKEEIFGFVKYALDEAEKENFVRGGFWIHRIGHTYKEYIQQALEKYMRLPYTYHYDVENHRWRVSIVHMPK